MTLNLSNPAKAKKERAPKPAVDAEQLKRLAARIEEMKDNRIEELIDELFTNDKMRMKTVEGVMSITMAGVTATATAGKHMALSNWAMAARREANRMEG